MFDFGDCNETIKIVKDECGKQTLIKAYKLDVSNTKQVEYAGYLFSLFGNYFFFMHGCFGNSQCVLCFAFLCFVLSKLDQCQTKHNINVIIKRNNKNNKKQKP